MLERTDKTIFYGSLAVLLLLVAPMLVYSQESYEFLLQLKMAIENTFGSIYQYLTVIVMIFILWLAISRYGGIRLGEGPYHFNTFSWASMLFCAGVEIASAGISAYYEGHKGNVCAVSYTHLTLPTILLV